MLRSAAAAAAARAAGGGLWLRFQLHGLRRPTLKLWQPEGSNILIGPYRHEATGAQHREAVDARQELALVRDQDACAAAQQALGADALAGKGGWLGGWVGRGAASRT